MPVFQVFPESQGPSVVQAVKEFSFSSQRLISTIDVQHAKMWLGSQLWGLGQSRGPPVFAAAELLVQGEHRNVYVVYVLVTLGAAFLDDCLFCCYSPAVKSFLNMRRPSSFIHGALRILLQYIFSVDISVLELFPVAFGYMYSLSKYSEEWSLPVVSYPFLPATCM